MEIVQAVKKLNSISRERLNFRRRPFLCASLYRNHKQGRNFGGTFDQLFLWVFLWDFHTRCPLPFLYHGAKKSIMTKNSKQGGLALINSVLLLDNFVWAHEADKNFPTASFSAAVWKPLPTTMRSWLHCVPFYWQTWPSFCFACTSCTRPSANPVSIRQATKNQALQPRLPLVWRSCWESHGWLAYRWWTTPPLPSSTSLPFWTPSKVLQSSSFKLPQRKMCASSGSTPFSYAFWKAMEHQLYNHRRAGHSFPH